MEPHKLVPSKLMDYLPAVYQGLDDTDLRPEGDPGWPPFLSYFLLAFEEVLIGVEGQEVSEGPEEPHSIGEPWKPVKSLEAKINDLHRLFEPENTSSRFLSWLAGWAALGLEASLSEEKSRRLVARIIPLYRIRGTKKYLEELLRLYLEADAKVTIDDDDRPPMQVGRRSTVGENCYLGGGAPHWFRVSLDFPHTDWLRVEPQCQLARRVIDLAKPAHTLYELNVKAPKMQVGVHSTVGVDTIFGG